MAILSFDLSVFTAINRFPSEKKKKLIKHGGDILSITN